MKKWIAVIIILLVFATALVYIIIPGTLKASAVTYMNANPKAVSSLFTQEADWKNWWPGDKNLRYNGKTFLITRPMYNAAEVSVMEGDNLVISMLSLIPIGVDSTAFEWKFELETGNFPFERIKQYRKAIEVKNDLKEILAGMKDHYEDEKNLYGFTVIQTRVTDSVLISTKGIFNHYPDEREINILIEKLRDYINLHGANEQNHPMLNVMDLGNAYEAKVAIAVDKLLPETKEFSPKAVLKGGNILEAEIRGGPYTIRKAFEDFERYKTDHERVNPAMPYQLMITDRVKETDTTKWITKLYYPVF